MDVRVALERALLKQPSVRTVRCSTWPQLSTFTVRPSAEAGYGSSDLTIKPDGFLSMTYQDASSEVESYNFLELDRGTESLKVLTSKMVAYRHYYRSGGFAQSRGGKREQVEEFPFRVLVVFKGWERRNNCTEQLLSLKPPIRTMVWLTTIPEVLSDPLGTVWVRPIDFQNACTGGNGSPKGVSQCVRYCRQEDRNALLDRLIAKRSLLGT